MVKTTDIKRTGKATNSPRFVGYVRVSTMHQEDKVSLEAQPDELRRYCEARGFDLVKVVSEVESAYAVPFEERPGGKLALAAIEAGEADGIIVAKLDRAFRSTQDAIATVEQWGKQNVSFVCIDFLNGRPLEQIDDDPLARFTFTIFAGLAQFTRDTIAANTRRALEYKQSVGEWVGRVPFGFRIDEDGKLVEDEYAQRTIQAIKRSRRRSGTSIRDLAKQYGVSVGTVHKIVSTDLRILRREVSA